MKFANIVNLVLFSCLVAGPVNARYYARDTGRWLEPEPTGSDGPNLYHFVYNDPINLYDPSGLFAEPGTLWPPLDDYIYNWDLPGPYGNPRVPGAWGDPLSLSPPELGGKPAGPGTTAGRVCYGVAIGATAGAVGCNCVGYNPGINLGILDSNVGWKGGEITFTRPTAPTPDWRINPLGDWGNRGSNSRWPHYHRRPVIGKHRPWDKW